VPISGSGQPINNDPFAITNLTDDDQNPISDYAQNEDGKANDSEDFVIELDGYDSHKAS